MIDFHEELKTIQYFWTKGHITKASAITQLESLMYRYGLLSDNEEIDPDISDNGLALVIAQVAALSDESIRRSRDNCEQKQIVCSHRCSICQKWVEAVFTEIKMNDDEDRGTTTLQQEPEVVKFNPPRCEECVREFLDEFVFGSKRSYIPDTTTAPMSLTERKFFHQYEEQMKDSVK